MNTYRILARSHRRLSKVQLWVLVPLSVLNAGFNAVSAIDQPLWWIVAGLWILAAVLFVYAGRANRSAADSYESAADAMDRADEAWDRARKKMAETTELYEANARKIQQLGERYQR